MRAQSREGLVLVLVLVLALVLAAQNGKLESPDTTRV